MPLKMVLVRWIDSAGTDEQMSVADAASVEPLPMENVGYLVAEDEDKLVLAFGKVGGEEQVRCLMSIPRAMIVSKRRLRE